MNPIITHAEIEEPEVKEKKVLDFEEVSVHDPSIIKVEDTYYIFGSHVTGAKSNDLKNWKKFTNQDMKNNTLFGNIQENLKKGFAWSGDINATHLDELGIWAPDVIHNPNYVNEDGSKGAYLMYLSMSSGEHYRSSIALAVSKSVEGPYEYVDTIVYSGFTNIEGEEHWSNTNFNTEFENGEPRSGYFRSNGSFNFDLFPNAIDPVIVNGNDGKQYMSYGSWNGGIYILEINQETGMPVRQENYNGGKADNGGDSYFGVKISGGYRTSGEGPYIVYDEKTNYYHYYVTYGFLTQESEYNMRFFRSKDIYGPYEDSEGNNPNFSKKTDNQNYGNKLMGSFEFKEEQAVDKDAKFFGYRVPGHNTIYQDKETGQTFNIFHTRFKDKGEGHEVRVHQMFFDEDGWPLTAPQRYNGEGILNDSDLNVGGSLLLVNHGQDNNKHSKESFRLSLNKDGSISGALEGTWNFKAGIVNITLGEDTYRGFVLDQSTPSTGWTKDLTYTLLGTSDKVKGQAAYFDGSTGIRLPEGQITSDRYSVQMWVNPEEITDFSTMFFGGSSNSNWVSFPMSAIDGKTMLWSGENWYDAITPKRIPQDRWSHLAATVDKGKVNVYIDGEIMFSGDDFPDVFNSPDTFAGIGVNFWDAPFKGLMDEFTIHNNAVVSASTIKEYYEDTKPEQEDFERNQEKTHIFKFEESLKDSENEELEGIVVGSKLDLEGGNIEYRDGKFGKAVYFDGESGIRLPDELITSEDYSVSLWINPEEIQPHTTTFFGAQNDGSWLSVVPESGETTEGNTMVWSGTEWYDGNLGSQIPIDEWSHIIFKVEEGSLFAYLNGEKVFEGDEFPDIFIEEKSVFSLGVNYWDEAFKGMIDELMVFDAHALSEEEIEDLFQGNFEEKSETDKIEEVDKKEDQETSSNRPLIVAGVGIGIVGILAGVYQYVLKLKKDKNI